MVFSDNLKFISGSKIKFWSRTTCEKYNERKSDFGHGKLVKRCKKEFDGRIVGFDSYDFNGPNGATHWVTVAGKSVEDHMMLYDELQKQEDFYVLTSERGEREIVREVEYEILKLYE